MKRLFGMISLVAVMMMMVACGSKEHQGFTGKFTDEFGNKFELREDYTATVMCHVFTPVFESMDVHDSHCGNFQMTPATIWREVKNK